MGQHSLYRQLRPGPGKVRHEVAANQRSRVVAATIELVAERGYDGTTVSDIARMAGVSKASFYEQFRGKEECFVATWDTGLRAAASAVLRGESAAREDGDRLRAGLVALAELIAAQPKGAKLVLVDGFASTPAIRKHVCERFGLLEALVDERLATADQEQLPRPLVAGVVRGIEHHARRCVGAGCPERLRDLVDPLLDWGLAFSCEEASALFAAPAAPIGPAVPGDRGKATNPPAPGNTRELLLAATMRLASRTGYRALTPSRIRRTAGVSRRSFDANFEDVTSCFLAAVEAELGAVFVRAVQAAPVGGDWAERTCLFLERVAVYLAEAPDLARLAFVETLEAAPASLRWRQSLIARWAEALYRDAPADFRPSPVAAEATVAAIWGALADSVRDRSLHPLSTRSPQLAFFILVPAVGPDGAAEAINRIWSVSTRRLASVIAT